MPSSEVQSYLERQNTLAESCGTDAQNTNLTVTRQGQILSLIPSEIIVHFSITLSSQELRSGIELGLFRIFLLSLTRRIALFSGVLLFLFTSTLDCRYLLFSRLMYCKIFNY